MPADEWILALDASTPRCVIALGRANAAAGTAELVAGEAITDKPSQASARLAGCIDALVASVPVAPSALCRVAVGRGPGTFTGTRVAVATAMGLAVGAGCPALPVSTLAAVAASVDGDGPVLALLDARRDEVYAGRFLVRRPPGAPPQLECTSDEAVAPLADLLEALPSEITAIGPGVAPYADALPEAVRARAQPMPGPTAAGLWAATVAAYFDNAEVEPQSLRAVYLRKSYAQMGVHPPKVPFKRSPFA